MKAKLISGLSLCCLLWPAAATETVTPQAALVLPKASQALVTDIIDVSKHYYLAVGERGHILKSPNGQTWQQITVPLNVLLTSVYFVDETHGWAVGHDASILHSHDGGVSWQIQQFLPELDKPLFDVVFKDRLHGIAVGAYGMFYRTRDGGKQWLPEFNPTLASAEDQEFLAELKETDPEAYEAELESVLPHFNRLVRDGSTLYMAGEAGFVAVSHDFGESWQRLPEFYNGSLFAIAKTPQNSLLVAGLRGHLFRSTDQGVSWQAIELPSNATLNSIYVSAQGQIYVAGNAGTLLVSSDDGVSFRELSQADGKAIMQVVTGQQTLILATETGIQTIQQEETIQP